MDHQPVLQMQDIVKRFPGVCALDHVNFELRAGEVHVILGENGAGKSTLIKILGGVYQKDGGRILLDGLDVDLRSPQHASRAGIRVIHQELNVLPELTVAENILLGVLPRGALPGTVDWRAAYAGAQKVLDRLGVAIDPRATMAKLTVAEKQLVEIAQASAVAARVVVMDEATAALNDNEAQVLYDLIASLKTQGTAIIFISHRIQEVMQLADRITVLRDGRNVGVLNRSEATPADLVYLMVGRELSQMFPRNPTAPGQTVLEVSNLSAQGVVRDVSFELRAGEILGLYGLVGAGCSDLTRALFGVTPISAGEIRVGGQPATIRSPMDACRYGLGYVPEERKSQGLLLTMDVKENITAASLPLFYQFGLLRGDYERQQAQKWVDRLAIRTPSINHLVSGLSGGNQQKVILARWLEAKSKILLLDDPTKGVDVAAKVEIYGLLDRLCAQGVGIIMISSELPEILAIADRLFVMARGRITGQFSRGEATQQLVMERCCL